MRLLIDTHIALWAIDETARLSHAALRRIEESDVIGVSVVAIWEIAIKHARRRDRPDDIRITGREARERFVEAGFMLLPVSAEHTAAVDDLPRLHGDPFDRLLIAQARVERVPFLTADRALENYGAPVVIAV